MHAEEGAIDARLRRALGLADQLEPHASYQIVGRIPLLQPMDVQARFFDGFESAGIIPPLTYRGIPAGSCAAGAEQRPSNTVLFFGLLRMSQPQRAATEIRRIKALNPAAILRLDGLCQRSQIRGDTLPGIEKSPTLPVEVIHRHGSAEIERYRRQHRSENKNAAAIGHSNQ